MSLSGVMLSAMIALFFAQVKGPAKAPVSRPTVELPGTVLEADAAGFSIIVAVKAGKEPPAGTTVEVYRDNAGVQAKQRVGMGRVTLVSEGRVTVLLDLDNTKQKIQKDNVVRYLMPVEGKPEEPEAVVPSTAPVANNFAQILARNEKSLMIVGFVAHEDHHDEKEGPKKEAPGKEEPGKEEPGKEEQGEEEQKKEADDPHQELTMPSDAQPGSHGTGFIISSKSMLLVTNAHVADFAQVAVLNEGKARYKVVKRWYHPGVMRMMDDGLTKVQSTDLTDGEVLADCADLAILKLEPEAGVNEQLSQVDLAGIDTQNILAFNVGIYGFPGYQNEQVIVGGEYASASFVPGTISRLSGLGSNPAVPIAQRQLVIFSARTYGGFSGAPVFDQDGKVIAVMNSRRREGSQSFSTGITTGLRVDALWELILAAGLQEEFPEVDFSSVRTKFNMPVDPRVERLRKAIALMRESAEELHHDDFAKAAELLGQAKELAPDYWRLAWQASKNICHEVVDQWDTSTTEQKLSEGKKSLEHLNTAIELYESSHQRSNSMLILEKTRELINIGRLAKDQKSHAAALEILNTPNIQQIVGRDFDYYLALRGTVKAEKQDANGVREDLQGALKDLNDAVRISPAQKNYYNTRSYIWRLLGNVANATADRQKFEQMLAEEHDHGAEEKKK